jgi:hypothetical protein
MLLEKPELLQQFVSNVFKNSKELSDLNWYAPNELTPELVARIEKEVFALLNSTQKQIPPQIIDMTNKKAVVYLRENGPHKIGLVFRLSGDKQVENDNLMRQELTIASLLKDFMKRAKSLPMYIVPYIAEGQNLETDDRRGMFKQLLRDIKRGFIDTIICAETDRIFRAVKDSVWNGTLKDAFFEAGIVLHAQDLEFLICDRSNKDARKRIDTAIEGSVDDKIKLIQRFKSGMDALIASGNFKPFRDWYGYSVFRDRSVSRSDPGHYKIELIDDEIEVYINARLAYAGLFPLPGSRLPADTFPCKTPIGHARIAQCLNDLLKRPGFEWVSRKAFKARILKKRNFVAKERRQANDAARGIVRRTVEYRDDWCTASVGYMLGNQTYEGVFTYHLKASKIGDVYKRDEIKTSVKVPSAISEDLFADIAQAEANRPKKLVGKYLSAVGECWLAGKLMCARCQRSMNQIKSKTYRYYRCMKCNVHIAAIYPEKIARDVFLRFGKSGQDEIRQFFDKTRRQASFDPLIDDIDNQIESLGQQRELHQQKHDRLVEQKIESSSMMEREAIERFRIKEESSIVQIEEKISSLQSIKAESMAKQKEFKIDQANGLFSEEQLMEDLYTADWYYQIATGDSSSLRSASNQIIDVVWATPIQSPDPAAYSSDEAIKLFARGVFTKKALRTAFMNAPFVQVALNEIKRGPSIYHEFEIHLKDGTSRKYSPLDSGITVFDDLEYFLDSDKEILPVQEFVKPAINLRSNPFDKLAADGFKFSKMI